MLMFIEGYFVPFPNATSFNPHGSVKPSQADRARLQAGMARIRRASVQQPLSSSSGGCALLPGRSPCQMVSQCPEAQRLTLGQLQGSSSLARQRHSSDVPGTLETLSVAASHRLGLPSRSTREGLG